MLESTIWILIVGFGAGQFAKRLGAPSLIGMILVGILLGPEGFNRISAGMLANASELRQFAVMVILMRAGLGLDRDKLKQQGSVALRLGFLPAICEAIAITVTAMVLFQFNWVTGLLLGCIISAESPAVIVPGMLRLKNLGWGVGKGIADAILTGSALSDVFVLLVFSLLINFLTQEQSNGLALLPLQVVMQIGVGALFGYGVARLFTLLLTQSLWVETQVQEVLVAVCLALLLVVGNRFLPIYSGYLAVMAFGFFMIEFSPPLARRMRIGFNTLWVGAEIVLFVLMGASIQLQVLGKTFWPALLILVIGIVFGRTLGWTLSTYRSNWNWKERLFLLPGNSAKATVQAAIGAVPLSLNLDGGDIILAVAALSILITAPFGAWAIPAFAPELLTQDPIDPAKVTVNRKTILLAAVDTSELAVPVLTKTAEVARRCQAEVIVVHALQGEPAASTQILETQISRLLLDVPHQFIMIAGTVSDVLLKSAQQYQADEIIMGKRGHRPWQQVFIGSVSRAVLATSTIPVMLVEPQYSSDRL
ncbi:cation:proton antiporter [Acaryochloris sp. CCMEE 5410]|uniref:cation:proton antiporter n=1 Tax=Acaryochloris sp. CCMEE 5410 TaxID=310037 RepID=UPI0002483792|nr:cation:proton antiporter [Acaryochloris sp. CCMEE 5410]KAI9132111.1 cation:proton antiporter [Acaryochloris sp. CCMEE 5410]